MMRIIYHESYLTGYFTSSAESPHRVSAVYNKLKGHYEVLTPLPASRQDILRVHTPEHLEKVQCEGKEVYETALLSAGGAILAAEAAKPGDPTFAIIRPPGHHARRSQYSGFCFFNNMAIAISKLLDQQEIRNAVIIDIDMHYGDGTAEVFSGNSSVNLIDIREKRRADFLRHLLKELTLIPPVDLIAVSAGFDLYVKDWGEMLETSDFQLIGHQIHRAAKNKAGGRCFAILEGGYYVNDLGKNALAFCLGLEGIPPAL